MCSTQTVHRDGVGVKHRAGRAKQSKLIAVQKTDASQAQRTLRQSSFTVTKPLATWSTDLQCRDDETPFTQHFCTTSYIHKCRIHSDWIQFQIHSESRLAFTGKSNGLDSWTWSVPSVVPLHLQRCHNFRVCAWEVKIHWLVALFLQFSDAVGWAAGRASGL